MAKYDRSYHRAASVRRSVAYQCHMNIRRSIDRSSGTKYAVESFSYDHAHLPKWELPAELVAHLPKTLLDAAINWGYAGAAVDTALDRINKLNRESIHRGYPEKSSTSHLCKSPTSPQAPTLAGAESPPMSEPISPTSCRPASIAAMSKLTRLEGLPRPIPMGMETPPITPIDSNACVSPRSPEVLPQVSPTAIPDAHMLTSRLTSISEKRRDSVACQPILAVLFDENAWETYLNSFRAELEDIRSQAWTRLEGCGNEIIKLRIECGFDFKDTACLKQFDGWFKQMRYELSKREERINQLELPDLEYVKLERKANMLPV